MIRQILLSRSFIIVCFLASTAYFIFSIYFGNLPLVWDTVIGQYSYSYKLNLLSALLAGAFTAISIKNLTVLTILSFLTGANIALIVRRFRLLKSSGHLSLVFGGGSILSLTGAGCFGCGLPILGFLGLSASVAHLPLKGLEVSLISIGLLLASFVILIKREQQFCKIVQ